MKFAGATPSLGFGVASRPATTHLRPQRRGSRVYLASPRVRALSTYCYGRGAGVGCGRGVGVAITRRTDSRFQRWCFLILLILGRCPRLVVNCAFGAKRMRNAISLLPQLPPRPLPEATAYSLFTRFSPSCGAPREKPDTRQVGNLRISFASSRLKSSN
jgi:hypothetical protein